VIERILKGGYIMDYRIWKEIDDLRDLKKGENYIALVTRNGVDFIECDLYFLGGKWCYNDTSGALYTIENVRNIIAIECEIQDILSNKNL